MRPLLVVAVLLVSTAAEAQPAVVSAPRRERVVSVGTWSMSGFAGLQMQYEQQLSRRSKWSWLAGGGFRFSARGDYGSSTLAVGGEARYWFTGRAVWSRAQPASMIGWFAGARADLAWTRTRDKIAMRVVGQHLASALTATAGYRFLVKGRVEVTPMLGMGTTLESELSGRLPPWWRGTLRMGMTVGWMF